MAEGLIDDAIVNPVVGGELDTGHRLKTDPIDIIWGDPSTAQTDRAGMGHAGRGHVEIAADHRVGVKEGQFVVNIAIDFFNQLQFFKKICA